MDNLLKALSDASISNLNSIKIDSIVSCAHSLVISLLLVTVICLVVYNIQLSDRVYNMEQHIKGIPERVYR